MWKSFSGDDYGDTQPVDTQTFVADSDITTSRIEEGDNGLGSYHVVDYRSEVPDGTAVVDLVAHVEEEEPEPEMDYDDVSDVSSQTDELANVFKVPKTPAMTGRKRNARGEVIDSEPRTSATKTPGSALPMAGLFGGGGANNVQLSQLFRITQAASSPLPNAPNSDPVFDRPSPNINFRNSSPIALQFTSPTRPLTADGYTSGRIFSDPLDTYVPMSESQEQRERRLRREQEQADLLEDDEFEESMSAHWRQQQKKIRQTALASAAELTAPDRRSSGHGRPRKFARSKSATDIASTKKPRSSSRRDRFLLQSDATDVPTDKQQAPLPQESSVEDMDIDELAITDIDAEKTNGVIVPDTSPHSRAQPLRRARHSQSSSYRSPLPLKSQTRSQEGAHAPRTTQKTLVVVNSQNEEQYDLVRPMTKTVPSSVSSQIRISQTQSQYSSLKPENQALLDQCISEAIDMSSVPRPPQFSPQSRAEEVIPSSPPLLSMGVSDDDDESLDDLNEEEVDIIGVAAGILQPATTAQLPHTIAETALDEYGDGAEQLHSLRPPKRISQNAAMTRTEDDVMDEESAPFATANSHISAVMENSVKDTNFDPGPNRPELGEICKFRDLTVETEPRNSIESADINFNILTEEDDEFHTMMSGSSPVRPKKRRKVYGRSALQESSKVANISSSDGFQHVAENRAAPTPKKRAGANEASESTSVTERLPTPTPQSTKKREHAGATAASHARQAITAIKNTSRSKINSAARVSISTKQNIVPEPTASSSGRPRPRSLKILEVAERPAISSSVTNRTATSAPIEREPLNTRKDAPKSVAPEAQNHIDTTSDATTDKELFPDRVLAMFRGEMNYYTATVLGAVRGDGTKFKVRYDDRNEDILDSSQLRRLDLRIGDRVKVELPKMRIKTYIIVGFSDPIIPEPINEAAPDGLGPLPDVHGHLNVQLRVKGRESLPTPELTSGEVFDIPVQYIYLPRTMTTSFADRKYFLNLGSFARLTTPSNFDSTPSTPSSHSRRQLGTTVSLPSVIPSIAETGLFANMAFAVTFSDTHDKEKEATLNLVQNQGARIIEVGFDQLFDLDLTGAPTPKKPSPQNSGQASSICSDSLNLVRDAKNLGFTALIADRYCRRAKYVQALALSIPCLHYRWVMDSIAAAKVLPFEKYLLPAGESAFLSGAVRSRSLVPYDPCSEDAKLKNILSRRDLLLGGKSVLVVKGKGKTEEKRKIYLFLTYALGATEVGRVKDLAEAKAELESRSWGWVYVDGEPEEAKKALFGNKKGIKRRRESAIAHALVDGKDVKVVGDEFVIQSLILGALLED